MANELDLVAQRIGRSSVKSVKVETSLLEPIVLTGEELFADTSAGSQQASWILGLIKPAVTIEMTGPLRAAGIPEIVIAPAGLPTGHAGWLPLALAMGAGAVGIFALGHWLGRRA